jgi:TorA maturation chaperone TorD
VRDPEEATMCVQNSLHDRVADALFRSSLYHTLALGFDRPDATMKHRIRVRWGHLLEAPPPWPVGVKYPMAKAAEHLLATSVEDLELAYLRLFDAASGCSLHETDDGERDREACLSELSEYYEAFGLNVASPLEASSRLAETQDHVGRELDFMGLLALKEAFALSREWYENLDVMLDAQAAFMRHHLGSWFTRSLKAMRERASHPFYLYLGEATLFTLEDAASRLNLPRGPDLSQ